MKLVYNDSENGISADVVEIADYGKEKFAVCETGGRKIYVGAENINTFNFFGNLFFEKFTFKIDFFRHCLDYRRAVFAND